MRTVIIALDVGGVGCPVGCRAHQPRLSVFLYLKNCITIINRDITIYRRYIKIIKGPVRSPILCPPEDTDDRM